MLVEVLIGAFWILYDIGKLGIMFAAYNEYKKHKRYGNYNSSRG